MSDSLPTVLCVDDDPNLLAALERVLFDQFEVTTATSGASALKMLEQDGAVNVVISDMRMPHMNGAEFLAAVRERWNDTVRILLTGQSDTESAIAAINNGAIYKYLRKPCSDEDLVRTLQQAAAHHRTVVAERKLLETTLSSTVKVLADVLALASPWAFRRAALARSCVSHALLRLKWPSPWIYQVAAALSQVGCIGVPEEILKRDATQRRLAPSDTELLAGHPETAYRLLSEIPRLDVVAEIVRYQAKAAPAGARPDVVRGAQLLRAALTVSLHLQRGNSIRVALDTLESIPQPIMQPIMVAIADFRMDASSVRSLMVADLRPGHVLVENVSTTKGQLLLSKGQELTEAAIYTLHRLKSASLVQEPICVRTEIEPT